METQTNKVHQGRNIRRFREMHGIKQEILATKLGGEWNQKKISYLESKETIDPELLQQVAGILNVPVEAINSLPDEQQTVNIVANTYNSHDNSAPVQGQGYLIGYNPTFNPMDKIVELYERMIKDRDEKIARLEKSGSE
ncbi:MAG TPA: helix-turn-helix transcriptional regulator [Flavisolibacter sp.]|nr:helix-turn-helix transcriptional regulator [Flavisolibacter sp.]